MIATVAIKERTVPKHIMHCPNCKPVVARTLLHSTAPPSAARATIEANS